MTVKVVCYLQVNHSDCRGCSSASAGRENRAEMAAGHRKMAWGDFSAAHCQMCWIVCFHLREGKLYFQPGFASKYMIVYKSNVYGTFCIIKRNFYPPFSVFSVFGLKQAGLKHCRGPTRRASLSSEQLTSALYSQNFDKHTQVKEASLSQGCSTNKGCAASARQSNRKQLLQLRLCASTN